MDNVVWEELDAWLEAGRCPLSCSLFFWQRMIDAVEAIRERTRRAATALRDAEIPYAVAGDNTVAAWVARVDRAAVRNTRDVNISMKRGFQLSCPNTPNGSSN